ncbi:hypothetical protein BCR33DRAFT_425240 [Rhizoclosmatium globosum]|uniref:PH domain-containing protein n=1 Tax=Rhizoclosmatium globosum TaxID=329046 RepID=A0A1Y2BUW5_9FUNG|nr:hypothetical protein BCR33DRAFT_425240 [Rhizoclosmatium globosum]|eukprot:ORY38551.1 hypothetical protein BCR33DRAFT_425240 [Rhizoclosmatium globosum]
MEASIRREQEEEAAANAFRNTKTLELTKSSSRDARYAALAHPGNAALSSIDDETKKKRNGISVFPVDRRGSTGSDTSDFSITVEPPTLNRPPGSKVPPPFPPIPLNVPQSPPTFLQRTANLVRSNTTATSSAQSVEPSPLPITSHSLYSPPRSTSITPVPPTSNSKPNSILMQSDDDSAISGPLKLHTNRLFRPWQDIVLVLSPEKRGLYYVKTGKGTGKTEQVVGFIEVTARTEIGPAGPEFRNKNAFRVVKVVESERGRGVVQKEYFHFACESAEECERWIRTYFIYSEFGWSCTPSFHSNPSLNNGQQQIPLPSPSQMSQEELAIQLQKQQRLLAQQKALMAAVAAQLQLQQEITAELQAAQIQQQKRLSAVSGGAASAGLAMSRSPSDAGTLRPFPEMSRAERDRRSSRASSMTRDQTAELEGILHQISVAHDKRRGSVPFVAVIPEEESSLTMSGGGRSMSETSFYGRTFGRVSSPTSASPIPPASVASVANSRSMAAVSPTPEKRRLFGLWGRK